MRAISAFLAVLALLPAGTAFPSPRGDAEAVLRAQLVSLLESGTGIDELEPGHPLRPIAEAPTLATLACLLFEDDPDVLGGFYPRIAAYVHGFFLAGRTTAAGFVAETGFEIDGGTSYPGINALVALELQSLSRIAACAGRCEDAIELRSWSYRFARSAQRYFYDFSAGLFMPVSADGLFESVYLPDQLLTFAPGRPLGERTVRRQAQRIFHETGRERSGRRGRSLWNDPVMRPLVIALLSGIDGMPIDGIEAAAAVPTARPGAPRSVTAHEHWISFWSGAAGAPERLRERDGDIFILRMLGNLLDREQLQLPDLREPFTAGIETIRASLAAPSNGLDRHREDVAVINRLLASLDSTAGILERGERIWKVFDEYRWDRLSPRQRKLVIEAHRLAIEDLMAAKRTLSARMMRTTGVVAELLLPERPVPAGLPVEIAATLRTTADSLRIERGFLQASGNRWEIIRAGETVVLHPGERPLKWPQILPVPPGTEGGLVRVEAFLDLLAGGRRIELHLIESFTMTTGYDVTLTFPKGRRIDANTVPFEIIIKHPPGLRLEGSVSGTTIGGMRFEPQLPARFSIREGTGITTLPLTAITAAAGMPGRYPLGLTVLVDGSVAARFEETLVRPMRWLHLGPLAGGSWIASTAISFTDNLLGEHETGEGGTSRWRQVPSGALDAAGAVLPGRLYGENPGQGMLLYTVLTVPSQRTAAWTVESDHGCRLWINGIPVTPPGVDARKGVTSLRSGRNAVLVAASWDEIPGRLLFEISDNGGLPLAGLANPLDEVVAELSHRAGGPGAGGPAVMSDQPREVTFDLELAGAGEVSLIGEFNSWEPEAAPMQLIGGDIWRVTVYLPPGTYPYKFLVDRKRRIVDPAAPEIEPDGFGGLNSVITVE